MVLQLAVDPPGSVQGVRLDEGLAAVAAQRDHLVEQRQRPRVVALAAASQGGLPLGPEEHHQLVARPDRVLPAIEVGQRVGVAAAPVEHLAPVDRPPPTAERIVDPWRQRFGRPEQRGGRRVAAGHHE